MKRALVVSFTLGCGMVHVAGLPVGGSSSSPRPAPAAAAAPAAAPAPVAAAAKKPDPKLVEVYQAFTYEDPVLKQNRVRGEDVLAQRGVAMPLHTNGGDPDPEWILGWERDSHGATANSDLTDAVLQAAINRTWAKACADDYAAWRKGWAELDQTYRPALEELEAPGSYYARANGLVSLMTHVVRSASEKGLLLPEGHPMRWQGLPYEIVTALYALHRETHRDYVLGRMLAGVAKDVARFASDGRVLSADDATERAIYCGYAEKVGTAHLPALPDIGLEEPELVRPVLSNEDIEKVNAALAAAKPARDAAFALQAHKVIPEIASGVLDRDDVDPKLFHGGPYTIVSVATAGKATVVVAETKKSSIQTYNCRPTHDVESVDANGYVRYRVACDTGTLDEITDVKATFDELPAAPEKGDTITFYGDVESDKEATPVDSGPHTVRKHDVAVTGTHVELLQRGKQTLASF